jgi:hypothetical protein
LFEKKMVVQLIDDVTNVQLISVLSFLTEMAAMNALDLKEFMNSIAGGATDVDIDRKGDAGHRMATMAIGGDDVRALMLEFQSGRRNHTQTMRLIGMDWYGDLLGLMEQYHVSPPLGGVYASPWAVELVRELVAAASQQGSIGVVGR